MLILGHRGCVDPAGHPDQNSLPAFDLALACCDGFESDACLSADGDVFLAHEAKYTSTGVRYDLDAHLDAASRALAAGRRLDQMDSATIRRLRLKDGASLPSLDEALDLFRVRPDAVFNIELKGYGVADAVLARVVHAVGHGAVRREQVVFSSFDHGALRRVREKALDIRLGMLFLRGDQTSHPLHPWASGATGRYVPFHEDRLAEPLAQAIAPDAIVFPETLLTQATLQAVRRHLPQAQLMAWTYTEMGQTGASLAARVREVGRENILGLIVDDPRRMTTLFRESP